MVNSQPNPGPDAWLDARRALLVREKELTRLRDEVSALRRALPHRPMERAYVFDSPQGPRSMLDLFGDSQQLLVYHFMFGPDWEAGCPSCTFWADHFDPMIPHLRARDTAFAVVSSAPLAKLQPYAERMGWRFPWVCSATNEFNREFAVTFSEQEVAGRSPLYNFGTQSAHGQQMPGASAFLRKGDEIVHTYSTYSRGLDILNGTYHWLDLTAKGRDEAQLTHPMAWVRRHDEYPG
ncbi:MAG: DUF899 domain-containing protein [Deltaproteobacteria bacterium]|nr:DUF899 domain-containing protein [Deltaproteobacteria bacterium]